MGVQAFRTTWSKALDKNYSMTAKYYNHAQIKLPLPLALVSTYKG